MAQLETRAREGIMNRGNEIVSLVDRLPDNMSDVELDGILHFLPGDLRKTMECALASHVRSTGMKFLRAIKTWMDGAYRTREEGGKVILAGYNLLTETLRMFEGVWPITSEAVTLVGVLALEGQGERYWDYAMELGLPDYGCALSMVEVGTALTSTDFTPDAIVCGSNGSCDINAKTHEFLARHMDIPLLSFEKPVDNSERGRNQYYRYFSTVVEELEEFLEQKLDEDRMREVLDRANRASDLYWELWDLHKFSPCPVPNLFSLLMYGIRFTMWGTEEAVDVMQSMVDVSKQRLERGEYPAEEEIARSLWIHTSYYFDMAGLFNWMEENGITHLGDGVDLFWPQAIDLTSRETMLRGIAEISGNQPMTRQMGADCMSVQWLDDIIFAARELNADCCIYSGHHSCKQFWSGASMVRSELMKRYKMPTLTLQGDSFIGRMTPIGALRESIEEFVNNVVKKRSVAAKA